MKTPLIIVAIVLVFAWGGWDVSSHPGSLLANVQASWWRYLLLTTVVVWQWRRWRLKRMNGPSFVVVLFVVFMCLYVTWQQQACTDVAAALERATGIPATHDVKSAEQAWNAYEARDPAGAHRLWEHYGKPGCAPPDPGDVERRP